MKNFDPERIALKVLQHKDIWWIRGIEQRNAGRQCHGRILKVWRWEAMIDNFSRKIFLVFGGKIMHLTRTLGRTWCGEWVNLLIF